jgi:tripartite-type tricarboxylate transporter receptor subunit TctC
VLAPAGTQRAIIDKLNREVVRIMQLADVRERLIADGADPVGNSPEEFAAHIKRELVRWAKVVKDAHIRVQ